MTMTLGCATVSVRGGEVTAVTDGQQHPRDLAQGKFSACFRHSSTGSMGSAPHRHSGTQGRSMLRHSYLPHPHGNPGISQ